MGSNSVPVQTDRQMGRALGLNHAQFVSYLKVLAPSKISILTPDGDHLSEVDKNLIWEDICVSYLYKFSIEFIF